MIITWTMAASAPETSYPMTRTKDCHLSDAFTRAYFDCRRHQSIDRSFVVSTERDWQESMSIAPTDDFYSSEPPPKPLPLCSSCSARLMHLGTKLRVPQKEDIRDWNELYDQLTAPGYWRVWEPRNEEDQRRIEEDQHWVKCKLRPSGKCDRCTKIKERIPYRVLWKWENK